MKQPLNHAIILTLVTVLSGTAWAMAPAPLGMATQRSDSYREAQRALDRAEWRDAADLFSAIAEEGASEADAALYWTAYALHKQGRNSEAAGRLAELRDAYPQSAWIDDADALRVEVEETDPQEISNEELKLYALNSLMNSDSERAVPVIEELLQGSGSVRLKEQALFVLSQSQSARARQILGDIAAGDSHPELRREAIQYLGISGDDESRAVLESVYRQTSDMETKKDVLKSFMLAGDRARVLSVARDEQSAELRGEAIELLGVMGAGDELQQMYRAADSAATKEQLLEALMIGGRKAMVYEIATTDSDPDIRAEAVEYLGVMGARDELRRLYDEESSTENRSRILEAYMIGGDVEALEEAARNETDPGLRMEAIEYLGITGGQQSGAVLTDMYQGSTSRDEKEQIIEALFLQSNAKALIEIIESESDTAMRREALEGLSMVGSDEAVDYLIQALKETPDEG